MLTRLARISQVERPAARLRTSPEKVLMEFLKLSTVLLPVCCSSLVKVNCPAFTGCVTQPSFNSSPFRLSSNLSILQSSIPAAAMKVGALRTCKVKLAWPWISAAPMVLMLTEIKALTKCGPCSQGT